MDLQPCHSALPQVTRSPSSQQTLAKQQWAAPEHTRIESDFNNSFWSWRSSIMATPRSLRSCLMAGALNSQGDVWKHLVKPHAAIWSVPGAPMSALSPTAMLEDAEVSNHSTSFCAFATMINQFINHALGPRFPTSIRFHPFPYLVKQFIWILTCLAMPNAERSKERITERLGAFWCWVGPSCAAWLEISWDVRDQTKSSQAYTQPYSMFFDLYVLFPISKHPGSRY